MVSLKDILEFLLLNEGISTYDVLSYTHYIKNLNFLYKKTNDTLRGIIHNIEKELDIFTKSELDFVNISNLILYIVDNLKKDSFNYDNQYIQKRDNLLFCFVFRVMNEEYLNFTHNSNDLRIFLFLSKEGVSMKKQFQIFHQRKELMLKTSSPIAYTKCIEIITERIKLVVSENNKISLLEMVDKVRNIENIEDKRKIRSTIGFNNITLFILRLYWKINFNILKDGI